jgi:hypothetical protein
MSDWHDIEAIKPNDFCDEQGRCKWFKNTSRPLEVETRYKCLKFNKECYDWAGGKPKCILTNCKEIK